MIKAREIMKISGEVVLADDSGLEIDYLNKEPGIYSARYMGEDTSYRIKNANRRAVPCCAEYGTSRQNQSIKGNEGFT